MNRVLVDIKKEASIIHINPSLTYLHVDPAIATDAGAHL
jgi:hypothetical protein